MKLITHFFSKAKDGGPTSPVDAFFLVEIKGLFSYNDLDKGVVQ